MTHCCPTCGYENTKENNPTVDDGLGIKCGGCSEVFGIPEGEP